MQPKTHEIGPKEIDCTACHLGVSKLVREVGGWRLYHCECGAWISIPSEFVVVWNPLR